MRCTTIFLRSTAIALGAILLGCQGPLDGRDEARILHESLVESIRREVDAEATSPTRRTERPVSQVESALAPRRSELDRMAGPSSYPADAAPTLSPDLTRAPQAEVSVTLQQVMATAVRNNLSVQIAHITPAITETSIVAAEAAFDAVLFSSVGLNRVDQPQAVPVLGGIPLGAGVNVRSTWNFETGLRKPLRTGGVMDLSTRLDRTSVKTPGFSASPDPAYFSRISLGLSQPLLRGFGRDVNEAEIRLARNADRRAVQQLQEELLRIVADVEEAYWDLVVARRAMLVLERLIQSGIEVRDVLVLRQERDATPAQYADAVATVERRQADLIRAQRRLRGASDVLKRLVNDPEISVGSEVMLNPVDFMVDAPVEYNLREAISTALAQRPELARALLELDDTAVRIGVARNLRLPILNLSARIEYLGLDDSVGDSYDELFESSFIDYILGLTFEQPIGNRMAEAEYRAARLRQTQAALAYRNAVQGIVFEVKNALRDVVTNYDLIQATRSLRLAQAENLRALLLEEELKAGLTPEFLNLKFQRQEGLANAELQELEALANFNKALARLYRSMGTGLTMNRIELRLDQTGAAWDDGRE